MTIPHSLPAFLLVLVSLCALPARAAYPVISTVTVAGSGGGLDAANGLAQDASGNLYVAGSLTQAGGYDIWVAKYSPSLVLLSSYTYDKAGFEDAAWAVGVDTASGGVFVAGYVSSTGAISGRDIWLAKFDSSLALLSTVTVNGSAGDYDEARGLRLHGGSVYVVGRSSVVGGAAHWAARYDTNLVLLSSSTFVQHSPYGFDIQPVASGNVFVAGSRAPNSLTSNDAWIGKYDSNLVLLASATINGSASNNDEFRRLADDGTGGVYAVGYLNTATGADRFIQRFDADLVRVSSSLVNGSGNSNEYLTDAKMTSSGTLLVAGDHSEAAGAGGINALIAEYSPGLALLSSTSYRSAGSGEDHAYSYQIGAGNQDVYAVGWVAESTQDAWLARFSTAAATPAAPAGLAASGVGRGAATLSWSSGGNPGGTTYELERSSGTGFGLRQASAALSLIDAPLAAASTYYYRVRARDASLVASAYSSTIAVVTLPASIPLSVASISPSSAAAGASFSAAVAGTGFDASAVLALERVAVDQGVWTATSPFTNARMLGTLTKLADGRLLLAGGHVEGSVVGLAYADIFDPSSGSWTATTPMLQGRNQHAAALLADGRVLVAGGKGPTGAITSTSEIYDPAAATWTPAGAMSTVTHGQAMVLLQDGRVLSAGGSGAVLKVATAERFDPATNAWSPAGTMSAGRMFEAMTILRDGRVLVSGDSGGTAASSTAELYDPIGNSWTLTGSMNASRYAHLTVMLRDGRVLAVSGGSGAAGIASSEIYDPATGFWTGVSTMAAGRFGHAVVATGNGALAIGGQSGTSALSSTEIYDAATNAWRAGPALLSVRTYPMAETLDDGTVLVAGGRLGYAGAPTANTAEVLYAPTARIAATGTSAVSATSLTGNFSLAGAATGYWDVSVRESGGRGTRLPGGFLAVSTPSAPAGFSGAAASASSILWTWTDASGDESGYRVMSGTLSLSGDLAANTTSWLQSGLGANTVSGPLSVRAFNAAGTAESSTATRTTFAAPPASLTASGTSASSATVSWSAGGNPAGTVFQLERSTGAGFGLQFAGAATSYYEGNLTPATTYYYRARALNAESISTAYSSTLAVIALPVPGLPSAAGAPAGAALGVSSLNWTWGLAAGATSHNLHRAASNAFLAAASSTSFAETGLTPNTAYGLRTGGVNLAGAGPLSAAATAYTLAAAPSGTGVAVTSTTIVATWSLNGNPASTVAELLRSTDAVAYSTLAVAAVASYADADLLGCTTYYYRVRNVNGDGLPTAYASFQGVTANTVPSPPAGLSAAANAGGTVSLSWSLSPTEGVTGYRLYWDAGAGTVSYGAPIAVLGSTATAFTTGVLTSSASYTFALRAAHRCGVVETTGASAMSGAAVALPAVRAAIKEPDSGRRINGNRVTILGEMIAGTPSDAQQVLFQYRLASSSAWLDVPAANVNHSNPDLAFPYFVHWDVTALAAGPYDLRAVAYDLAGVPDSAPPAVRVVVDPVTPDISETLTVEGKIKKDQTVSNSVISVVETAGAGAGDPAVRVTLPPGVVNTTSATLSVISNPTITTAAPAGQSMVGSAIKIGLSNGQTALAGTAAIVMTYPDTVRFPSLLQIYYLDEATGAWSRDFTTTVDAASRTVTGNTPHFSTFVLMLGTAFSANLDSVQVYPVPYKPNGRDPDEGRPFTHGDANSGIIFANLASASEIEIYTLSGRLVSRLDSPSIAGTVRWDARNQDGRDVASGAYFAVITAPGQRSVVKKLVVIR